MKTIAIYLISLLFGSYALAHGEDKPGPHGGHIRMPGAFHTELVPNGKQQFKIYLLDINWKNPSVTNSQVEVQYLDKAIKEKVTCQKEAQFFQCQLANKYSLQNGKIAIKATREGATGSIAEYNLPLSFQSQNEQSEHSSHGGH